MRCWSNANKCCKTAIKIGISIIRRQAAYVSLSLRRLSLLRKLHQFTRSEDRWIRCSGQTGWKIDQSIEPVWEGGSLSIKERDKPRVYNSHKSATQRWDAYERKLAYKTTDIFATAIRGMFCRSSGRDHIANLSMFKDISSASRSMIRKVSQVAPPLKMSVYYPYSFSRAESHTRPGFVRRSWHVVRGLFAININCQIELTSFTIVLQFVSLDSLNYWLIIYLHDWIENENRKFLSSLFYILLIRLFKRKREKDIFFDKNKIFISNKIS